MAPKWSNTHLRKNYQNISQAKGNVSVQKAPIGGKNQAQNGLKIDPEELRWAPKGPRTREDDTKKRQNNQNDTQMA